MNVRKLHVSDLGIEAHRVRMEELAASLEDLGVPMNHAPLNATREDRRPMAAAKVLMETGQEEIHILWHTLFHFAGGERDRFACDGYYETFLLEDLVKARYPLRPRKNVRGGVLHELEKLKHDTRHHGGVILDPFDLRAILASR